MLPGAMKEVALSPVAVPRLRPLLGPPPAVPTAGELLLGLHAAVDIRELWDATCRLLHGTVNSDFVCLCLRPFELLPGTIFRDRHPFRTPEELLRFNRLSLLQPYLAAHPGLTLVRLSDVVRDEDLVRTPFYRECMAPCGYFHVAALAFWNGPRLEGVVCPHRSRAAGLFTRAEMRLLERLHPAFDVALRRVLRLYRDRAVRLSLERFMQRVPLPAVLVNWDGDVIYANRAAAEAAHVWRVGRETAHRLKRPAPLTLPDDLAALCGEARAAWQPQPQNIEPGPGTTFQRAHPTEPGLSASVTVLQFSAEPQQRPTLLLQWQDTAPGAPARPPLGPLTRLSPAEQELALRVCEGWSTRDLATRLGKSPLTIKTQLQSIYRKLEVPGRSRLMAVLR